ncbi:MAG: uroporphyrinogen-III C-methyltransferase [Methylococcales bacterium]|nr:uroporphyrinogen-III C-methyltransferase [Methylococcales bacterium]
MGNTVAEEVSEEQLKNEEQVQNQPVENKPKKSYGWLVFGIINFLLILVLAGGGYYLLQEIKGKQLDQSDAMSKDDMREIEASKQLNAFQSQLGSMQSQIATFSADIAGKDTHFTKTLADFSQLHTEKLNSTRKDLSAEISQLKRQLGKTRGDWLLADAEYLLSVANQRLHLMGDVKTTRMALEAADQRLRESGDSAAFKVRGKIAKEIESLRSVKQTDVVGVYASIQLLKDRVAKLAVILPYAGKPLTESKQIHDHDQTQESEHGVLNSALQLLEGYVTVKHSDQPVTAILTTEEVEFIRQQLGVKVEMIKIALVQQNDALYKTSITDTKQWLNANFTKNTEAKSFQAELDRLINIQLSAQLPDVSQSLKMLKDITKLRIEADKGQMKKKPKQLAPKVDVAPKAPAVVAPIAP